MKYKRDENGDVYDYRFTFINGRKTLYSDVTRGMFVGYTVVLRRPNSSTYINLESEEEAWDTINDHVDKHESYVIQDEELAKYLASDEGKWGRSDGYGNSEGL